MTKSKPFNFFLLVAALVLLLTTSGCGGGGSSGPAGEATQNVVYTYDALNRLTSVRYGDGRVVAYTYDAAGNVLSAEAAP